MNIVCYRLNGQLFTHHDFALSRKDTLLPVWRLREPASRGLRPPARPVDRPSVFACAGTIAVVSQQNKGDFAYFDFIIGEKGYSEAKEFLRTRLLGVWRATRDGRSRVVWRRVR
jgi:hypothetical protein